MNLKDKLEKVVRSTEKLVKTEKQRKEEEKKKEASEEHRIHD